MSALLKLSQNYGSFFWECTKFAVSPYTNTFMAIANPDSNNKDECMGNIVAASLIVGVLTFVVPVLPVLSLITFALASIAMLLAVASMFVTYPVAILTDACTPYDNFETDFHMTF